MTKQFFVACVWTSSSWDKATHWCRSCALRFWETQRADICDTWKLSGIIYSTLTVETCNIFLQFLTPLLLSFPKPVFHSSSWQLVRCIRRPTRTWITFWRFAATCEFVESNLVTVNNWRSFTIHSNQTLINNFAEHPSVNKKLYNCMLLRLRSTYNDVIHGEAIVIFWKVYN